MHIESSLKTLKAEWVVYDMLYEKDSSEFGWDAKNHVLKASKDVWIPYIAISDLFSVLNNIFSSFLARSLFGNCDSPF